MHQCKSHGQEPPRLRKAGGEEMGTAPGARGSFPFVHVSAFALIDLPKSRLIRLSTTSAERGPAGSGSSNQLGALGKRGEPGGGHLDDRLALAGRLVGVRARSLEAPAGKPCCSPIFE